ncbi:hypothetical protein BDY24DRAFT_418785 [Mrakia frigida]|uniref:uncharacterized protein n=1 Tax=Mrakia frigida TaxID=29902 RepID=UPI003FCBF1D3
MSCVLPSSLLRPFPTEVFLRILFFCSTSTLAVCSRLSHEFLGLASERLWRKNPVAVSSSSQLHLLFQRVSRKHQNDYLPLPPFFAQQLDLRTIQTLVLDGSCLLRTSLVLGSSFNPTGKLGLLRPKKMVVHSSGDLLSVVNSIFKHVRPEELVYLVPNDLFSTFSDIFPPPRRSRLHPRANHVVVVVHQLVGSSQLEGQSELTSLFFGIASNLDPLTAVPRHPCSLQYVLPPSACMDRAMLSGFLEGRHRGGVLLPGWWGGKEGSVVVEVADEEAKGWVEAGKASIPRSSRKLLCSI